MHWMLKVANRVSSWLREPEKCRLQLMFWITWSPSFQFPFCKIPLMVSRSTMDSMFLKPLHTMLWNPLAENVSQLSRRWMITQPSNSLHKIQMHCYAMTGVLLTWVSHGTSVNSISASGTPATLLRSWPASCLILTAQKNALNSRHARVSISMFLLSAFNGLTILLACNQPSTVLVMFWAALRQPLNHSQASY